VGTERLHNVSGKKAEATYLQLENERHKRRRLHKVTATPECMDKLRKGNDEKTEKKDGEEFSIFNML